MKLWLARDLDGTLKLHESKPYCPFNTWHNTNQEFYLDNNLFPEVTYDNSPQEVELKLINEIVGVAESPLKTFPRTNIFEVGASYRH